MQCWRAVLGELTPHSSVLLSSVSHMQTTHHHHHQHHQVLLVSVPTNFPVEVPPERRLYAGVDNFPR